MNSYFLITLGLLSFIFFCWAIYEAYKFGCEETLANVQAQAAKVGLARVQEVQKKQEKVRAVHETIRDVLPNDWPESGVIELHQKGADLANQITSADLQLDRD